MVCSRVILRRALACASLITIAAVATPASAQQIDRIVVFGNSYADTGNALSGSPASTPLPTQGLHDQPVFPAAPTISIR